MRRTVRSAARERDWAMVAGSYAMHSCSSDRFNPPGPPMPIGAARQHSLEFAPPDIIADHNQVGDVVGLLKGSREQAEAESQRLKLTVTLHHASRPCYHPRLW
jgi:hypothetical protein